MNTILKEQNVNPGLQPYELSEYHGVEGKNYFELLPIFRRYINRIIPEKDLEKVVSHLTKFGQLAAEELNDLIIACHKEGKYGELQKFDRHGNRIDEIIYSAEQNKVRQLAWAAGLANLDCQESWSGPFHYEHRECLAYMANLNGEGGYTCPLAMTEGMIEILRQVGSPEQQKKYLPIITSETPTLPFGAGQYLTERVGGSNIGANRTIAKQGKDGKWYLTGEKWFCSNPGDLWVTTAKIEGTSHIGAFLVTRYKEDGTLNNHNILRLKDIIGSRGKVTAEIEYDNVEADLVGRMSTGLALVMRHVIGVSRVHVSLGATAGARRAFLEAREYAKAREAFGKKIKEYPSIVRSLAQMQVNLCTLELANCYSWSMRKDKSHISELITPLLKYICSSQGTLIGHAAIMIHGGNGILGDYSVLPRMLNDGVINETWEGTHNIIANHTEKAFRRMRVRKAFFALVDTSVAANVDKLSDKLKSWAEDLQAIDLKNLSEANRIPLCDKIYSVFGLALIIREIQFENEEKLEKIAPLLGQGFVDLMEVGTKGVLSDDSVFLRNTDAMTLINF